MSQTQTRRSSQVDLLHGPILKSLLLFALPIMAGNLLQQLYNIADTLIVGQALGRNALAAVGSAYTLMVFLISILLGLSIGSGTVFSLHYGAGNHSALRRSIFVSFVLIGAVTCVLNMAVFVWLDPILRLLQVPQDIYGMMRGYLWIIFCGIVFTFIYNFYAAMLRAVGDSVTPLWFLALSVALNIVLDLFFILQLDWGIEGAAIATVMAQGVASAGIVLYTWRKRPELRLHIGDMRFDRGSLKEIVSFSTLTCVQQSVMNLGILIVQGLVNSFGSVVMAAFAAAVKIDAFAYMPVQDFGNAFSTYIAQNYGAKERGRIRAGLKSAVCISMAFCIVISALVFAFARPLMGLFVDAGEREVILEGVGYLRIEGAFYCGIGCLFLLYGLYRALGKPGMSVVLTVISLGTRVALAYLLSAIPAVGVIGIWWSVPIGWGLADLVGFLYYKAKKKELLEL